jgi:hypothetical protein
MPCLPATIVHASLLLQLNYLLVLFCHVLPCVLPRVLAHLEHHKDQAQNKIACWPAAELLYLLELFCQLARPRVQHGLTLSTTKTRPRMSWPVEWPKPHRAPSADAAALFLPIVSGVSACTQACMQRCECEMQDNGTAVAGHSSCCQKCKAMTALGSGNLLYLLCTAVSLPSTACQRY